MHIHHFNELLDWYQVDHKGLSKALKLEKWKEIRNNRPPTYIPWTDDDEASLAEKKMMKIDMRDTAVGRYKEQMKIELSIAASK